ncbi:10976_t:CDS:2, partial [Gigaspora margarita]
FTLRSGGQTGVDLGMLDATLNHVKNNPKVISKEYKEENSLLSNIRDANATLILLLSSAKLELDGTSFTIEMAKKYEKELKLIYLDTNTRKKNAKEAFGPQENNCLGVYGETFEFVSCLLKKLE